MAEIDLECDWMAEEGRLAAWQADGVVPVTSHILLSLPGSERASFPRLAREGGWQANRIRSEVTRCSLAGTADRQTFSTARTALFLCDGPQPQLGGRLDPWITIRSSTFGPQQINKHPWPPEPSLCAETKPMGGAGGGLAPPVSCSGYC